MRGGRWWLSAGLMWTAAAAVLAFVTLVEKESVASIGWTWPTRQDLRAAGLAFAGGLVGFAVIAEVLRRARVGSAHDTVFAAVRPRPPAVLFASAVTAGVTEEVLFRGFGIERLGDALGSYGWAGAVLLVLFVLAHVPLWGWVTAASAVGPGAAFTWLYVETRNLPACIAAHTANDVWAFVLAPRVLARRSGHIALRPARETDAEC